MIAPVNLKQSQKCKDKKADCLKNSNGSACGYCMVPMRCNTSTFFDCSAKKVEIQAGKAVKVVDDALKDAADAAEDALDDTINNVSCQACKAAATVAVPAAAPLTLPELSAELLEETAAQVAAGAAAAELDELVCETFGTALVKSGMTAVGMGNLPDCVYSYLCSNLIDPKAGISELLSGELQNALCYEAGCSLPCT